MKILIQESCGELEAKRSRFLCHMVPVQTEEQAQAYLARVRAAMRDARHHAYACVLDAEPPVVRMSDDGEPSQTAGKPILDRLRGAELVNVLAVVTRYFGGTLLGTGGLTRAYSGAAAAALDNAVTAEVFHAFRYEAVLSYAEAPAVRRYLETEHLPLLSAGYGEKVTFSFLVPEGQTAPLPALADLSRGQAELEKKEQVRFIRQEGSVRIV